MLIREFQEPSVDSAKLASLAQFLISRSDDRAAPKKISVGAFLKLAQDQGISLTQDSLINMSQRPPLSNLIRNIQGDEILFKGDDTPDDTMSVDQAQKTVDSMAKRATKKDL